MGYQTHQAKGLVRETHQAQGLGHETHQAKVIDQVTHQAQGLGQGSTRPDHPTHNTSLASRTKSQGVGGEAG